MVKVIKDKGWLTGYHCVVVKDGSIHPFCRWDRYGNHAKGHNLTSLGIAFNGNFETEISETYLTFEGDVEAHNELYEEDQPLSGILFDLMKEWNIELNYDWNIEYGGFYSEPPLIERD